MDHEEEPIGSFIMPTRRQRYLDFVSKPKTRQKFLCELAHFKSLDPRNEDHGIPMDSRAP
jgi:hypothetical protein